MEIENEGNIKKHFKVKKTLMVAVWKYSGNQDTCPICRGAIMGKCIDCLANLNS